MPAKKKGAPASTSKAAKPKKPHGLAGKGGHKNHAANAERHKQMQDDVRAVLGDRDLPRLPTGQVRVIHDGNKPRPNVYDSVLVDRICAMFKTDPRMSLSRINADPTLPTVSTFYDWRDTHPDVAKKYTRAREIHADLQAEELGAITRNPLRGEVRIVKSGTNADGTTFESEEVKIIDNVDRARLIVDTDKWILSKLRPKKYGVTPQETGGNDALDELLGQFRSRSKEIEDGE